MAQQPTLLFCVGAAKAGTSWLHRYLADHPEAHVRGVKELHYFDTLDTGNWERPIAALEGQYRRQLQRAAFGSGDERAREIRRADDTADWLAVMRRRRRDDAAYLGYLEAGRGGRALVADVTPAYGLLSEAWLETMARLRPMVRFVYLLRDPVDRLWSHCRMIAERRAAAPDEIAARARRILGRVIAGREPEIARRSDYAGPLGRLRAALAPGQLFLGVYEELFREGTIAALCRFLGLTPAPADLETRVFRSPIAPLGAAPWRRAQAHLAPQYAAVERALGRLPADWGRGGTGEGLGHAI